MAFVRRDLLGGVMGGLAFGLSHVARAAATGRQAPKTDLVIGALFPSSGAHSAEGNECLRGVQLATELCNAGGGLLGRAVKLALGDASDPDRAVAEARRIIAEKQPALIFGTGASVLSLGASEASEGSGVPYWELTATLPSITTRGFHYLVRVCDTENNAADLCLDALAQIIGPALGITAESLSAVFLYADDAPGSTLQALLSASARRPALKGGTAPMSVAYQPGAADFGALAARLAVMQPDVLIHYGEAEDVVLLHAALSARRWRPRALIGMSGAYGSAETATMVGPDFDGTLAIGVVPYGVDARLAPSAAMVATLYEQHFGAAPRSGLSLSHFAGASLCFDAIRLANSVDKDKLLAAVRGFRLGRGTLANGWGGRFGADGQNQEVFASLSQWQNGRQVMLLPKKGASGSLRLRA